MTRTRAVLVGLFLGLALVVDLPHLAPCLAPLFGYGGRSDFAQDYLGARALLMGADPYPMLGPAFASLGLDWPVQHRSTHPPTAFLLALPVSWLPYPSALAAWSWLMLGCLALSLCCFGVPWRWLLPATAGLLLWPPALWSLGQLTPLWLLGLCLAWRYRHRPVLAGAAIALASLPKLLGAVSLLAFWPRHPRALAGFSASWLLVLVALSALSPISLSDYLTGGDNSLGQILRPDNGALLAVAWRLGPLGLALALGLIALATWRTLREPDEALVWATSAWLGVALLPIAWTYSLLPLLPALLWQLRKGTPIARGLAVGSLFAALLAGPPSTAPLPVAMAILLAGFACLAGPLILHHAPGDDRRQERQPLAQGSLSLRQ